MNNTSKGPFKPIIKHLNLGQKSPNFTDKRTSAFEILGIIKF